MGSNPFSPTETHKIKRELWVWLNKWLIAAKALTDVAEKLAAELYVESTHKVELATVAQP